MNSFFINLTGNEAVLVSTCFFTFSFVVVDEFCLDVLHPATASAKTKTNSNTKIFLKPHHLPILLIKE